MGVLVSSGVVGAAEVKGGNMELTVEEGVGVGAGARLEDWRAVLYRLVVAVVSGGKIVVVLGVSGIGLSEEGIVGLLLMLGFVGGLVDGIDGDVGCC